MSFWKRLAGLFSASAGKGGDGSLRIAVECARCGETIRTRVDLGSDLSPGYGEGEPAYFCRKVLVGNQGCYAPVEVELRFDAARNLTDRQVSGGTFAPG